MRDAHWATWCSGLLGNGTDGEAKVKEVSQCVHLLSVCISAKRWPWSGVSWTILLTEAPRDSPPRTSLHSWYLLALA